MTRLARSAALVLALAVGAVGSASAAPVAQSRPLVAVFAGAPFAPASVDWVRSFSGTPLQARLEALPGSLVPAVAYDPVVRVLAGWGYSHAEILVLDGPKRAELVERAALEAGRRLRERVDVWSGEAAFQGLDEASLGLELDRMRQASQAIPLYAHDRVGVLGAGIAKASSLRAELVQRRFDAQLADVEAAAKDFDSAGRAKAVALVGRLRAIGEDPEAPEPARLAAAATLGRHLGASYGAEHGRYVVDSLTAIGLARLSPAVQGEVVRALGRDVSAVASALSVHEPMYPLTAMVTVAQASADAGVKAQARATVSDIIAAPSRGWASLWSPSYPRRLRASALAALAPISVSGAPAKVEPIVAAPPAAADLKRAWRWSLGSRALLVGQTLTVASTLIGQAPLAVLVAAPLLFGLVGLAGFASHHRIAAFVHMGLISGVFASALAFAAITGPLGAAGWSVTFAFALLLSAFSVWSLATHRVRLGAAVLLALFALF